jgi:hypothetical protein
VFHSLQMLQILESSSLPLDFRNKFGALHQQFTPNRERELYSTSNLFRPRCLADALSHPVHLTAVTDTRRTSTIISNGLSNNLCKREDDSHTCFVYFCQCETSSSKETSGLSSWFDRNPFSSHVSLLSNHLAFAPLLDYAFPFVFRHALYPSWSS